MWGISNIDLIIKVTRYDINVEIITYTELYYNINNIVLIYKVRT